MVMPSKYDKLAGKEEMGDGRIWNRYGFSESEWLAMTTEQREVHYTRQRKCEHPYEYDGPSWSGGTNLESLRTSYSHDPYFHTAHMAPCKRPGECDCQMCLMKIGISRDQDKGYKVNEEKVRAKWREKFYLEREELK